MTVTGHVLGPQGKSAADVPVDIIGIPGVPESGIDVEKNAYDLLGQGTTDGDGRFQIEASHTRRLAFMTSTPWPAPPARAAGFGSVKLDPDAEQPATEIRLPPEEVIRGRLVDVSGQPAVGVEVRLNGVYGMSPLAGGGDFDGPGPGRGYIWSRFARGLRACREAVEADRPGRFLSPASVAASPFPWPSATPALPSRDLTSRPAIETPRKRSPWPSIRRRSSRVPCPGGRHRPAHP